MTERVRLRLKSLDKDQLVRLVEDYKDALDGIRKMCVRESKGEDTHELFNTIRIYLNTYDDYDLNSDNLSAHIDLFNGKISVREFWNIVSGVDENE